MTTIVFDAATGIVASDSRWSIDLTFYQDGLMLYVDDSGFSKIVDNEDYAMMLAGSGILIERWKNWFEYGMDDNPPHLTYSEKEKKEKVSLAIINKHTRRVAFKENVFSLLDDIAMFAGSGYAYAMFGWSLKKCAINSVDLAKIMDHYTGGNTEFLNCMNDSKSVINSCLKISEVNSALLNRGMVMNLKNKENLSINSPGMAELKEKLTEMMSVNAVCASAPMGNKEPKWDSETVKKLDEVIEEMRAAKKKRMQEVN